MKKYLIKVSLFLTICFGILTFIMIEYGAYIDYFYNKFTTPKASSMILGDSRSMQGIQPSVIDKELKEENWDLPMYNYSFTIAQAPIGELYINSILRKLDEQTTNGIFVISMTPWMLASEKTNDNSKGEYREADGPPHNMYYVSMNPNYEYLLKNLNYFHFQALFRKKTIMHKDGWLELNNQPKDHQTFVNWKNEQAQLFDRMIEDYQISEIRLQSLDVLVKKLKKHGRVFLVRMPIDLDFLEKENGYYPNFDNDMKIIAQNNQISYFNFNPVNKNMNFDTYDGHHLNKAGTTRFTGILCDSIKKYSKNYQRN